VKYFDNQSKLCFESHTEEIYMLRQDENGIYRRVKPNKILEKKTTTNTYILRQDENGIYRRVKQN